jgi:hypothetical protein
VLLVDLNDLTAHASSLGNAHHYGDPPHPVGLLRVRRERPTGGNTAEKPDELAPSHSITSSARASTVGGSSKLSISQTFLVQARPRAEPRMRAADGWRAQGDYSRADREPEHCLGRACRQLISFSSFGSSLDTTALRSMSDGRLSTEPYT